MLVEVFFTTLVEVEVPRLVIVTQGLLVTVEVLVTVVVEADRGGSAVDSSDLGYGGGGCGRLEDFLYSGSPEALGFYNF